MRHPRPRVVVSECLGFSPTRYDGNMLRDEVVEALKRFAELLPICPEVRIGLGIPRNPLVLVKEGNAIRLIDAKTGDDFSQRMIDFASSFAGGLKGIDGFLMKSKSPSCGVGDVKIYGKSRVVIGKSDGVFTGFMREAFPLLPIESEKRLLKYEIRRNFLTKIFSIADLRETLSKGGREDLAEFHRRNKYILMLYAPGLLKKLGKLVAERGQMDLRELKREYGRIFLEALSRNPGRGSYANVFIHIYGHVKRNLVDRERSYILNLVEEYRMGRSHLKMLTTYFRGFIYRLGSEYLAEQRFMEPYPEELEHVGGEG